MDWKKIAMVIPYHLLIGILVDTPLLKLLPPDLPHESPDVWERGAVIYLVVPAVTMTFVV
jgi:hypothetical protein